MEKIYLLLRRTFPGVDTYYSKDDRQGNVSINFTGGGYRHFVFANGVWHDGRTCTWGSETNVCENSNNRSEL